MVKINLLAEGKRPIIARKARQAAFQINEATIANIVLVGVSAAAVLLALVWFLVLHLRIQNREEEIRVAQKEVDELQQVIKEVQQYETKLAELRRKVEVITTLKDNQRGPVQIMDEVSRALPELLWLNMMQVTATTITFRGSAFNMSAVANFIDNLDRVEAFTEPILRDATRAGGGRGPQGAADLYNFQLAVNYSFKREPPPAGAEGSEATTTSATGGAIATAVSAKTRREGALE